MLAPRWGAKIMAFWSTLAVFPHRCYKRHRARLHVRCALGVAAAAVSVLFAGCTPIVAYRTELAPPDSYCFASEPKTCAPEVLYEIGTEVDSDTAATDKVYLGIVEFDDQGYLLEPDLKDQLISRVQKMAEKRPLLMVVYAHGWKHNAYAEDKDIEKFQEALLRIAADDHTVCAKVGCARRQVVGIYLGWRGLSATVEPFTSLSFWMRKSRAHRVGLDGATEVLAELAKIKSVGSHSDMPDLSGESRLVLTGHSFGGALLYTATEQLLMRDTAFPNRGSIPRNVADLIVLVNPAFEAARFHGLQRRASSMTFSKTQRPILAVFTSKTDGATKYAFPFGRRMSTLFGKKASPASPNQHRQNVTALGHYEPFWTHELVAPPSSSNASLTTAPPTLSSALCGWQNYQSGRSDTWDLGEVQFSRLEKMRVEGQRQNPYMVVTVDGKVIAGHSDIWGERFSEFLYKFVAVQSARPGEACQASSALATSDSPTTYATH